MRNLKRVLSLALASVMLLGMMVVGSSAAFSDGDEIEAVYEDAVEITAGLGLFAGADGKFDPKGTLTRAQMATVIVKMLYGSDYNADSWKGLGKFPDTADYQGGWAEGYIALCASLGIVGGYPNGKFEPGNPVNAAEAATMIINALDIDAGEGEWPATVMTKADELKLFGGLLAKPNAYKALTREELASTVLVGINTSPSGKGGWTIKGTGLEFDTQKDALMWAKLYGEPIDSVIPAPAEDTLATKVFGVKTETGFITANQATGAEYTTLDTGLELNLETGADMVGHYVTAYYNETVAPTTKAYAIVDEADYVTVSAKISDKAKYTAAFGSVAEVADETIVINGDVKMSEDALATAAGWVANEKANAGTYVIYNKEIKGYIAPVTVYAGAITDVKTDKIFVDKQDYSNKIGDDKIVEYEGIAKGDIVLYNKIGNVVVVEEAGYVEGKITKITGNKFYLDGTKYEPTTSVKVTEGVFDVADFKTTFKMYLDNEGKYLGLKAPVSAPTAPEETKLGDIYYVYETFENKTSSEKESIFGSETTDTYTYYANVVDMAGNNTQIVIGKKVGTADLKGKTTLAKGFYTFTEKSGIMEPGNVDSASNDDKDNLYYSSLKDAVKFEKKTNVYLPNAEAFLTSETKFILVADADKDPDKFSALKTAAYTGTMEKERTTVAELILGFDAKKNKVIKAVIIETTVDDLEVKPEDPATNYVYITPAQIAGASRIDDDLYELNVYFIADGKIYTITTKDDLSKVETGFYSVKPDAENIKLYDLVAPYATNIVAGVEFERMFGENMMVAKGYPAGIDVSKAYVVDVRADDDKGDVSTAIDSIEDIEAASAKGKVIMDLVTKDGKVTGIYVLSSKK